MNCLYLGTEHLMLAALRIPPSSATIEGVLQDLPLERARLAVRRFIGLST